MSPQKTLLNCRDSLTNCGIQVVRILCRGYKISRRCYLFPIYGTLTTRHPALESCAQLSLHPASPPLARTFPGVKRPI